MLLLHLRHAGLVSAACPLCRLVLLSCKHKPSRKASQHKHQEQQAHQQQHH
jgi:hypothetical protein